MDIITAPLPHIFRAKQSLQSIIQAPPLIESPEMRVRIDRQCYLKPEILQPTRSFKLRGAANKIFSLTNEQRKRGIITVSTGNHGRAVAYVAKQLGIQATVCISNRVPQNKVQSLRQLGANVVIYGQSQDDAEGRANELCQEHNYTLIHPFDDPHIIAGQGTIGIEIVQELPDVDTVLVPLSGGGLISGIALALKAINPKIRVIGICMQQACVMYHSLQAGKPVELPEHETLADSLLGGIGLQNQYTFSIVQQYVDDVVLISEEDIAYAMAFLLHEHHMVVEGAGAVGIAALLANKINTTGSTVSVISGGNVDMSTLLKIAGDYRSQ